MIRQFNGTDRIGEIVRAFPGLANLFLERKVDFCCGGDRPIGSGALLEEVNALYEAALEKGEQTADWSQAEPWELAEHIVNKHHAYLHEEFPDLADLVLTILNVHGLSHPELFRVHRLFNDLKTELEEHLIREEQMLFPAIEDARTGDSPGLRSLIAELIAGLEAEHEGAGDLLKELREAAGDYVVPAGACRTYEVTYRKLVEMERDIFLHISLENNVLFPMFGARS